MGARSAPDDPFHLPAGRSKVEWPRKLRPVPIKGSHLLLGVSLAVNVALLATILSRGPSLFSSGPAAGAPVVTAVQPAAASTPEAVAAEKAAFFDNSDLKALIARMRSAGYPPKIIKAIITAQVSELMATRRRELAERNGLGPYWSAKFGEFGSKTREGLFAVNKEGRKMLSDLLGPDGDPVDVFGNDFRQKMNGGLSPEKAKRLTKITNDYWDLKNEIISGSKGVLLPEDYEKLAYLDKEQQADIADSMTPDELFEFQIRNSGTAYGLREKLQGFNPSEDEFRAIFKVQQAYDQQYGNPDTTLSPSQQHDRQTHQGEILAQLQTILSPDRLAEYKDATDPKFVAVNQVMARFDLPVTATRQVMDIEADITKRADAVRNDKSLTDAERSSQLAALADEAKTKATAITGDRGFEAYKQSAGAWIQSLTPPPAN
jgi:hypothetical protein